MRSLPRRRWIVESRAAPIPNAPWAHSLGPFFRRKTAEDYMRRVKWFSPPWLVAWRIRDVGAPRESEEGQRNE